MSAKWMQHKGKKILYLDFRGSQTEDDLIQVLAEAQAHILAIRESVLTLSNYEGVSVTTGFLNRLKEMGRQAVQNQRIDKLALLGITEMKNVLVQGYLSATGQKNVRTFAREADALDWLAE